MKKYLAIGITALMTIAMIGCGSDSKNTGGSAAVSDSNNGEKVETLTVLMYTDWYKAGWEALEKHINDNSEELGFKLEISKIQGGAQGDQVLQTKFATDDLPDIIQVYKPQWVDAYVNGLDKLVDLTGLESASQYDEKALE